MSVKVAHHKDRVVEELVIDVFPHVVEKLKPPIMLETRKNVYANDRDTASLGIQKRKGADPTRLGDDEVVVLEEVKEVTDHDNTNTACSTILPTALGPKRMKVSSKKFVKKTMTMDIVVALLQSQEGVLESKGTHKAKR